MASYILTGVNAYKNAYHLALRGRCQGAKLCVCDASTILIKIYSDVMFGGCVLVCRLLAACLLSIGRK